jgi:transcriptional regulator with XRE-family HTH domain
MGIREYLCCPADPALGRAAVRARGATVGTQLGQRIRELRVALSFTQEALAEGASISVPYLSMIERAERLPHVRTLAALANALGITLSQLFLDVNGPQAEAGQAQDLPLIAYIENLHLDSSEVASLLAVAKAMFGGRP